MLEPYRHHDGDQELEMNAFQQGDTDQSERTHFTYQPITPYQDAFSEAFFPTENLAPKTNSYGITLDRQELVDYQTHPSDGSLVDLDRHPIYELADQSDLIREDSIQLLPHLSGEDDSEVSEYFVDDEDIATEWVRYGDEDVAYRPLKPDVILNLLSLSQRTQQVTGESFDYTDAIRYLRLKNLYIELSDGDNRQIVTLATAQLAGSEFISSHEGSRFEASLYLRTDKLYISQDTETVDDSDLDLIPEISEEDMLLRLSVTIYGRAWLDTGELILTPTTPRLRDFVDSDGEHHSASSYSARVIGFDLDAVRANENWRAFGALVDTSTYQESYNLYAHQPIFTPAPPSSEQISDLPAIVYNAVRLRQRNAAVTALLNYAKGLSQYTSALQNQLPVDVGGIGRFLVHPFYKRFSIDIGQFYDDSGEPKSVYVYPQIGWHIAGYLRPLVDEMLYKTGYASALRQFDQPHQPAIPRIVIGCHVEDQRYLYITDGLRLLTRHIDHEIVSTSDHRMRGKLFISFTRHQPGSRDGLSFGVHAYVPESVERIVMERNGGQRAHLAIRPRYRHIPTLPILAEIDLLIGDVYASSYTYTLSNGDVLKIESSTQRVVDSYDTGFDEAQVLTYGRDGSLYVAASNEIQQIDPEKMTFTARNEEHTDTVTTLFYGSEYLYSGGDDSQVQKIDPATMDSEGFFEEPDSAISDLEIGYDSALYVSTEAGEVYKVDTETMDLFDDSAQLAAQGGYRTQASSGYKGGDTGGRLAFSSKGRLLAIFDDTLQRIDPSEMSLETDTTFSNNPPRDLCVDSDNHVFVVTDDGQLTKLNAETLEEISSYQDSETTIRRIRFSKNGYLAATTAQAEVVHFDPDSLAPTSRIEDFIGEVVDLGFNENNEVSFTRPTNESPADESTDIELSAQKLKASAPVLENAKAQFDRSEWELIDDADSVIWDSVKESTFDEATISDDTLEGDVNYTWRVRFHDSNWGWSPWSELTGFSTVKPYIAQPTNQSPADSATDIDHGSNLNLEADDFKVNGGDDSLNEAEWELYVSGDSSPFWTTTTTNTTATVSSTELDGDTEYEWRVRYQGEEWGWSDWSDKTSFTTEDPYVAQPDNLNPNDGESGFEEEDITLEASDFEVVGGSDTFQEAHWEVWKKGSGEDIDTSSVSPQDSELIFSTKSPSIRRPDGKSPSKDEQHVLFSNGLTLRSSDFKINGDYDGELACEFKLYRSEDDKLLWEKTTDQLEVDVPADQLEYGSDYYWQVRHYDPQERLEASNWSKPVTFTTLSDPSSYTYLTTENGKLRKRYGHALSESIRSKSYEHTFDGLALGADGKLYAAHTTEISRIDADTLEIETTVDALSSKACAFTADSDNYLFVGYDSGLIERIDSQDFGVISTYDEPAEPIRQLQVVDDDNLYAIDDTLTLHKLEIDTDTKVIDSAEQIDLSELTDKTIVEVAIDQQGMVLLLLEDSKLVRIDPDNEDTLAETYLDISSVDGIYVDRANKVHISSTEETYELLDALELTQLKIADSGAQRLTDAV